MANGMVIWKGPSRITGQPIVLIATWNTRNHKTGDMIQTWILRDRIAPLKALTEGKDEAICGDCPLRNAGCYVQVGLAPSMVWNAYKWGYYPTDDGREWKIPLRMGSYGDPVAVPSYVWRNLLRRSKGWTGYTHLWRHKIAQAPFWKDHLMASVQTVEEAKDEHAAGWRYYGIGDRSVYDDLGVPVMVCPASDERGHSTTCAKCQICSGRYYYSADVNVVIAPHGARKGEINHGVA